MEEKIKFTPEDLRIEKLSKAHIKIIETLTCYIQELVDFLIEDSLEDQNKKISSTYLWFERSTNNLVGYITLLTDKINLDAPLKESAKQEGIRYKELPALKIGRLCVDDKYQKRGIGTLMIKFAIIEADEINHIAGCRFLTLDAKRNEDPKKDPIHFYKSKLGFKELIHKGKDKCNTPLYRDLTKIFEYPI